MNTTPQLDAAVDDLIRGPQYALPQAEKQALLLPIVRELCARMGTQCPPYGRLLERLGRPADAWEALADIPPLPTSMFKQFELRAVPVEQVIRELNSSATTGQQPSRIFIDKTTAFRQTRALASILKEHIGGSRRPFLVLDAAESAGTGDNLGARGAAIRGIGNFGSSMHFALRRVENGDLEPDWDAVDAFAEEHGAGPVLLFGFTFIVWTRFLQAARAAGRTLQLPQAHLLHSGGWKKLQEQAVSKEEFSQAVAGSLGCPAENILDFYGMAEQLGTVFVDCEQGNKHAPAFADVVIRNPSTLAPVGVGESGIIEVVSVLPTSYPGQALITEDQGTLVGVDDCRCGRRGNYFRFTRRIERTEVRGCGDTFAQLRAGR